MSVNKRLINYTLYGELLRELVKQIDRTKFDLIYGIQRGGLPIAIHLSHFLEIDFISILNPIELSGKRILMVVLHS